MQSRQLDTDLPCKAQPMRRATKPKGVPETRGESRFIERTMIPSLVTPQMISTVVMHFPRCKILALQIEFVRVMSITSRREVFTSPPKHAEAVAVGGFILGRVSKSMMLFDTRLSIR